MKHTRIANLIQRFQRTPEERALLRSHHFLDTIGENNVHTSYAISFMIIILALVSLFTSHSSYATAMLFKDFPSYKIYLILIHLNVGHILLLFLLRRKKKISYESALILCYLNFLANAVLAGLTLYCTQFCSGMFYELILIMAILSTLPYYQTGLGALVIFTNFVTTSMIIYHIDVHIVWKDQFDLLLFYLIGIACIVLRRYWLLHVELLTQNLRDLNAQLHEQNRLDPLTGLYNRVALREDIEAYTNHTVFLAMIDVDNFKQFNDGYGHSFGDSILRQLGTDLQELPPLTNYRVYRYGGDEFLLAAIDQTPEDFRKALAKLQTKYELAHIENTPTTLSIGYCYGFLESEREFRSCVRIADDCLYFTKTDGKNRIRGREFQAGDIQSGIGNDAFDPGKPRKALPSLKEFLSELQTIAKKEESWTIIFFDIDRFKEINQNFGYRSGNLVLNRLHELFEEHFPDCPICRYDADHFIVFCNTENPIPRIKAVQQGITKALPHSYIFLRAGIYLHVSWTEIPPLMNAIDDAKYACDMLRQQTAVRSRYYTKELDAERKQESYVLNHFNDALEQHQIIPFFQPITNPATGEWIGFEALARWTLADGSYLPPGQFVPVLEHAHDSHRLDFDIMEKTCCAMDCFAPEFWDSHFLHFNISGSDFDVCDVPKEIEAVVSRHRIPTTSIHIEITESVMQEGERIYRALKKLRQDGHEIWLDDFGSGVSSLNKLTDFKVDGAKLDRRFLHNFEKDPDSRVLIMDLIALCHTLEIATTMEGVETESERDFIEHCGCDYIQGFLFSRPLSLEEWKASPFFHAAEAEGLIIRPAEYRISSENDIPRDFRHSHAEANPLAEIENSSATQE